MPPSGQSSQRSSPMPRWPQAHANSRVRTSARFSRVAQSSQKIVATSPRVAQTSTVRTPASL